MKSNGVIIALLLLAVTSVRVASADSNAELAETLRQVTEKSLAAYDRENAEQTLEYIHSRSPDYEKTRVALPEQFEDLDVRPELVYFDFIGHDDEFAVARVKLKTVATDDAAFQNNIVDSIMLFHQEDGVWKAWSECRRCAGEGLASRALLTRVEAVPVIVLIERVDPPPLGRWHLAHERESHRFHVVVELLLGSHRFRAVLLVQLQIDDLGLHALDAAKMLTRRLERRQVHPLDVGLEEHDGEVGGDALEDVFEAHSGDLAHLDRLHGDFELVARDGIEK
jgi:hypothetical protein